MKPYLLKFFAYRKTMFFGFLVLFFSVQVFAQPANDNCTGAILLTSSTTCNPTTGTLINATKYTLGINGPTVITGTWTPPLNVTSAIVECWGGGGGGGGTNSAYTYSGGGGGGGYSVNNALTVTSTKTYTINTGTGGSGSFANGVGGNTSSFVDGATTLVSAAGGGGGTRVPGVGVVPGLGTGGAAGIGSTYNGGSGAAGNNTGSKSGGGGGGAGTTANGNSPSLLTTQTGGIGGSLLGGNGGNGQTGAANGTDGLIYGGGGGGGRRGSTGTTNFSGGNGANGAVRITYADCGSVNSPDVWYRFVAQSTNPRIVISNSGNDLVAQSPSIQLLSGAGGGCGTYASLASVNANVLQASGLTIGTTYYIRITTNTSLFAFTSGTYNFDICVMDPLPTPTNYIDFAKSYINITDGTVGGTINQGDILEIRATLVVKTGATPITNVSYYDTLKVNAGFIFKDSIATRTNEGKVYKAFTNAIADDAGWLKRVGVDTAIQINIGTGATFLTGGTLTDASIPNFYSTCIIMATYRVRVDTGVVGYGRKINFGGGAFRYSIGASNYTISFPRDSLIVYPTLTACSDAVSPGNLIGNIENGTFGTLPNGSNPSGKQNGTPLGAITTYNYETVSTNVNDYYYGILNNLSKTNSTNQTVEKVGVWPVGIPSRVFDVFDITGDHTGATDQAKGNKPCDPTRPIDTIPASPTYNPCGYFMIVNAAYKSDVVFEYTATGACAETYYEVSAWFKNICYRCGADSMARNGGSVGYIPTAPGDSSGVRPNIAMKVDGVDYYTTGELVYQGLGGTQSGSDTLNKWVRRAFVFKTGVGQTSFKITFRNNAPGGGGNDWAIDDIGLRTCYPTMTYAPPNPIVFMGNPLTISDTVRSYFNSYSYYQWEKKKAAPGSLWIPIPGASGNATPVFNPLYNQYEYVNSYTIVGDSTQAGNAGDLYRMVVASSLANLTNGCNYTPSTTFTLLPSDATCLLSATNYAIAPQTGSINWNKLNWSLGHIPTCCESAHITYTGTNAGADAVTVNITNDICIINLTLQNTASSATNKIFKTILHPGYSMQMNGYVRMGAPGALSSDSAIFIARGGGTITVNGNTTIGYPADNAYCIFGSSPDVASNANYVLKGDSLTFNGKSFTNDKLMTVTMNPFSDTAYLVNNTNAAPYPNAVSFENLKIGNGAKTTVVVTKGTNQNSFINDRSGALEVTTNATLILPANYTINKKGTLSSTLQLRANSKLRIGGYSGGTTGSNFPANFTTYTAHPSSTVDYYGDNSGTQTVYGMTYGKLELLNGSDGNGAGRAQKNSIAAMGIATWANVNKQVDFTLGALGSNTSPILNNGVLTVVGGLSGSVSGGLFCNANVIGGFGSFALGNYGTLGSGHAQGISASGFSGNIQTIGARTYNTTGNYTYNGIVNQITGNGLPSSAVNDLTIDNPTTVTIANNQLVNGIHLLKQGTFDIGTTQITINGLGTMNAVTGKMKADAGTVEMKGTVGQNLSGNWFVNKTISNLINANTVSTTVAVSPADTLLISTKLSYGAVNNSTITTNDNLTLLSRATGTANFADITNAGANSGNTIVGKVNIERYLFARRAWRFLATPAQLGTSPSVTSAWRENNSALTSTGYGTQVTGPASYLGMDATTQRGSLKSYNPATNVWDEVTNSANTLANNAGYMVFVRGDRGVAVGGTTIATNLRIKGNIRTGNQTFTVPALKFQSFGNPYPSRIDMRTVTKTNIANAFIAWNPTGAGLYGLGAYETYTWNGTNYVKAGGIIKNFIESGEAVFVQSNSATAGSVVVHEADKGTGSALASRPGVTRPTLEVNLFAKDVDGSIFLADGVMLNFDNTYSPAVDNYDVRKIMNVADNLAVKNGTYNLVVERRPNLTTTDTIKLSLTGTRVAPYRFDIDPSVLANTGLEAILIDKFLQTEKAVSFSDVTSVPFDITTDAASKAADRFMIVFKQAATTNFTTISATRNADKTVAVNWGTQNERNITNYTVEQSNDGINFTTIGTQTATANNGTNPTYSKQDVGASKANNWYRVKATSTNGTTKYTAIAMVGAVNDATQIAAATMSIYPNPVVGGNVNLHLDNQLKGNYSVQITNAAGQQVKVENVQVENNSTLRTIQIGNVATGTYQAMIVDEAGKKTTINFIVK
jgi:hypothetical protein